jgi:hypothetical protein
MQFPATITTGKILRFPFLMIFHFCIESFQHCQGVIEHGKSMRIFRSFHTITNDGNLAIHAMLTAIEER